MRLTLHVWRQAGPKSQGRLERIEATDISQDMSFLEMLDKVNEDLIRAGKEPIAFDHDCREGICGACGDDDQRRRPRPRERHHHLPAAHAQLPRRRRDPHRAVALARLPDHQATWWSTAPPSTASSSAGGYVSVNTGAAQDANALPIPKPEADLAMDAAACIGCGACVASCPNGSAMLFVAAKIGHLAHLPQGQPERYRRASSMVAQMDAEGFGPCSNHYECEAVCPKEIPATFIAGMNRDFLRAKVREGV